MARPATSAVGTGLEELWEGEAGTVAMAVVEGRVKAVVEEVGEAPIEMSVEE